MTGEIIASETSTSPPSQQPVTITTDQSSYNQGDTIAISGKVNAQFSNTLVNVRIVDPSTNLVFIAQLLPNSDGSFSKTIRANGPLWVQTGTYTLVAELGPNISTTTTFYFSGGSGQSSIKQLIIVINTMNIQQGIAKNLDAKLNSALSSLDSHQNNAAIHHLDEFIIQVLDEYGKNLTSTQTNHLVTNAVNIITSIQPTSSNERDDNGNGNDNQDSDSH